MLFFLTGGARSGKSSLALRLAIRDASETGPVTFIATGEAFDDEMTVRIRRHQTERPSHWATIEEPRDLARAVAIVAAGSVLIIDCLSLWVSNLMFADHDDQMIEDAASELAETLLKRPATTIVVTNEVGFGIVPDNALARRYRDVLGRVNATLAAAADNSYLCVAGRVVTLTPPPA